jgi:hypothetical protein
MRADWFARGRAAGRGFVVKAVFTGWLAVIAAGLIYMFAIVALGR